MNYVIYNPLTGAIKRLVNCPESMFTIQIQPGEAGMPGTANDATQYINNGVITDKPQLAATLSKPAIALTESATIANLPMPATVRIDRAVYEVPDGSLTVSFNLPGTYRIECSALNHLPQTLQVTVS